MPVDRAKLAVDKNSNSKEIPVKAVSVPKTKSKRVDQLDDIEEGFQMEVSQHEDNFGSDEEDGELPPDSESGSDSIQEGDSSEDEQVVVRNKHQKGKTANQAKESLSFNKDNLQEYLLANPGFLEKMMEKRSRQSDADKFGGESSSSRAKKRSARPKSADRDIPKRQKSDGKGDNLKTKKMKRLSDHGKKLRSKGLPKDQEVEVLRSPSTTTIYERAVRKKGTNNDNVAGDQVDRLAKRVLETEITAKLDECRQLIKSASIGSVSQPGTTDMDLIGRERIKACMDE